MSFFNCSLNISLKFPFTGTVSEHFRALRMRIILFDLTKIPAFIHEFLPDTKPLEALFTNNKKKNILQSKK